MREAIRARRREVLLAYGGACACCGEASMEFLTIDHIEGGGDRHRQAISGRPNDAQALYRWLKLHNYPEGFRVLCYNCHGAISYLGACPHGATGPDRAARIARGDRRYA